MHRNILTSQQKKLLPLVSQFSASFYLVGGTALALQLGHRRSIDFDLFTPKPFDAIQLRALIKTKHTINRTLIETKTELTAIIDNVKFTWYIYPYTIDHPVSLDSIITMPNQLTIAAMKTLTLGRRAKWKDYVDLYFVFKSFKLQQVVNKAEAIFGREFDEKLFRQQLAFHQDLDYSEAIEYLPGLETKPELIKSKLTAISLS